MALALFFVAPLWIGIKNNSDKIISIKSDAVALDVQSGQIEDFKKMYQSYRPNLEKMEKLFVDPQNPVDFIKFLEDAANISGVQEKISLLSAAQKDGLQTIVFQVSSSEDFLRTLSFLEELEYGHYLVGIENVAIRNSPKGSDASLVSSGKVDASFSIKVFAKQEN